MSGVAATRPSGSRTALGLACLWPWTPQAQPWPADEPGPAAARGTRMHARAAAIVDPNAPVCGPLDAADEELGARAMADAVLALLDAAPLATELAFAYDSAHDGAYLLGAHLGRDYRDAPPGTRCMSLDGCWYDEHVNRVTVVDFKTGMASHVEPARENAQLITCALAAARFHGATSARIALVFEAGRVDSHDLDALDLDAHAERLRANDAALDRGDARPAPGSHCGYCPARLACPATQAAVAEVLPELAQPGGMLDPIQGPEDAAQRVVRLRMVEDAWEQAKAQADALLRDWARANGPIPLGGGKVRALVSQMGRETFAWTDEDRERARAEGRVKRGEAFETWREKRA